MLRKNFEPNVFFSAVAQDFGKLEAHKMIPLLFLDDSSYVGSYLATQTDCSGEDTHLDSSADDGGKGIAPLHVLAITGYAGSKWRSFYEEKNHGV
jgi:hypothetical protein